MSQHTKAEVESIIEKAFATRQEGNELLKAGELGPALLKYHAVLLALRGLDSSLSRLYPAEPPRFSAIEEPRIQEIVDDKDEEKEGETKDEGSQGEVTAASKIEEVRTAIKNTYLNSAAIYIKQERWKRALEAAQSAKKLDEDNVKAKFREAQARIGLGEINTGKKMLEELQKSNPDSAITAALNKLSIDEKAREAKATAQFKGMFNRKKGDESKNGDRAQDETASSAGSAAGKGKGVADAEHKGAASTSPVTAEATNQTQA
ncbi:hypothetical protein Rhopal_005308-T1 [Rhodotorula paludigena]|uniref:peptidylprolyl isomerase n=1 Tax=Rhodotorula paludigena TaxID=86838 RepID=A0AAV5GQ31_9BASI|nr:hypothetical protein Rhopal_005308-T1 [Rhodotorula paludigena]